MNSFVVVVLSQPPRLVPMVQATWDTPRLGFRARLELALDHKVVFAITTDLATGS